MPPPASIPRYHLLGTGISAVNLTTACGAVLAAIDARSPGYVCTADVRAVDLAAEVPAFRAHLNGSLLTTPDGMPLVWLGPRGVGRVYGPDLMLAVCDAGRTTGLRHYFFGGAPGVAELLREKLTARFPGLEVVGTFTPPYRPLNLDESAALRADVARTRPDIIWVGLGTPKQERFMAENCEKLDAGLLIGVGAAFDFHSGRVRQAPRWMQRTGLEWFFRLCTEPRRLGPRYLKTNPLFVLRVLAQKTGLKKYPLD